MLHQPSYKVEFISKRWLYYGQSILLATVVLTATVCLVGLLLMVLHDIRTQGLSNHGWGIIGLAYYFFPLYRSACDQLHWRWVEKEYVQVIIRAIELPLLYNAICSEISVHVEKDNGCRQLP